MVVEAAVDAVVEEDVIMEEVAVVAVGIMEVEELPIRIKLIIWTMMKIKIIMGYSKMKITIIVITKF